MNKISLVGINTDAPVEKNKIKIKIRWGAFSTVPLQRSSRVWWEHIFLPVSCLASENSSFPYAASTWWWQGNTPCDVTFVCALCHLSWQAQVTFISIVPSAVLQGTLATWQLSGLHLEAPATEARTMAGSSALGNENILSAPQWEGSWHRVTDQIGTGWGRVASFLSLFTSLPVHPQESSPNSEHDLIFSACY